jgi:hypothetical protein
MRQISALLLAIGVVLACGHSSTQPPAGSFEIVRGQVRAADGLLPVQAAIVTTDFFQSTGAQPLLGRFFVDGDQNSSANQVVVLSHDLWSRRFSSAPTVIGRPLEIDGRTATIIGIATRDFDLPAGTEIWMMKNQNVQK